MNRTVLEAPPKRLLLIFGGGGQEIEVEVEDPKNTTLADVFRELKSQGKLPSNFNISDITVVHGDERVKLDLNKPVAELGLPDNAVLKVLSASTRSIIFGRCRHG